MQHLACGSPLCGLLETVALTSGCGLFLASKLLWTRLRLWRRP